MTRNPTSPPKTFFVNSNWKVVFAAEARRQLARLPDPVVEDARDLSRSLAEDPYPSDSLRLRNNRSARRIPFYHGRHPKRKNHVALYRLIYEVFEATHTIRILRIAYRDEVTYSGFDRW